jgi:O-antigen/teichoic acid export membrane protein
VVLKQSFPYALLILLMTFYYRTDTLMLERMLPDGAFQAGIYAQGFRFFEAFNMIGYLFAGLLLPIFSRQLKHREAVAPLVVLALRLVLGGSLAVAAFVHWNAQPVLELIYAEHTALSAPSFLLLIHCFVGVCVTYVFGTLLTASGDLRLLNCMAAGGALLNVALNLLLIPRMQAEGAAWASLATQLLTAGVQVVLAGRSHALQGVGAVLVRAGVYGAVLLSAGWATLGLELGWRAMAFAVLAAAAVLLTGLITPRVVRDAMKLPRAR